MKHYKWGIIAIIMLLAQLATAQNSVVAYVDVESVIQNMPEYKKAKSSLEAYQAQQLKLLEAKKKEIATYYQSVLKQIQAGDLTQKQQQAEEAKLQKMQADLQQQTLKADQELIKKEKEYTKPMYERFETAINKVAQANKYDYIIEKQFILGMSGNAIDATAKIKAELGI